MSIRITYKKFVMLTVNNIDIQKFAELTSAMAMEPIYGEFGRLVRGHRQRLKLTQDQLAERVGLSRTSITNIETGRQKVLLHQLFQIAESLEITPDALLPRQRAPQVAPGLERTLGEHLPADAEREWARRILTSGSKGGAQHAQSKD
jgi:transcriptional regulator with XRE-family HTH domain